LPVRRPLELSGSLAVVTGAARGIGAATAAALAGAGARVVGVDLDGSATGVSRVCDVADWDQVAALAAWVEAEHGVPDIVVNNAGVGMSGRLTDMTIDDWRWIRSVNLDGVVHGCMAFGPAMVRRQRGHLVNVSSGLAYMMRASEPAYVTTKAAVLALSRCLQADWAQHGVGVTAVCPGVINTPIVSRTRFAGADPEARRRDAQRVFRRGHKPELVASTIVDAVRRNRTVVAVGWEAKLGWALHRSLPIAVTQRMARS
jgi:2-hydroxycyclohexanecarboxyl-CoA dehydrogenase